MSQMGKIDKLALLGGLPVRREPFPPVPFLDERENQLVFKVLESRKLSCYVGSTSPDIDRLLAMSSREAQDAPLNDFNFLGGPMVRKLEAGFALASGTDFAMAVNSATSGLSLAIGALRLEPGDEIVTTCMSFTASSAAILSFGLIPRFADISTDNYCIDPEQIAKAIGPRTKAILVVHLYGFAADMGGIMDLARRRNLKVIEDCAQALGTTWEGRPLGSIGDAGVYSLNHPKNITAGEGGVVVTNDRGMARHVRLNRNHGEVVPDEHWSVDELVNIIGFNMRMTELTAAVGVAQLEKLAGNNAARNENSDYLSCRLHGLPFLTIRQPDGKTKRAVHVCPFEFDSRAAGISRNFVVRALQAEGIPVGVGYPRLLHLHPCFTRRVAFGVQGWPFNLSHDLQNYGPGLCPKGEALAKERLITFAGVHRPCTFKDMDDVVRAFDKVLTQLDVLRAAEESTT